MKSTNALVVALLMSASFLARAEGTAAPAPSKPVLSHAALVKECKQEGKRGAELRKCVKEKSSKTL